MKRIAVVAMLALAAVACSEPTTTPDAGPTSGSTPAPSASATPASGTTQVTIYYLISFKNELYIAPERHRIARTQTIARAAMEELLHGTAQDPDHTTPFPVAATINSVTISNKVATVDWSADVLSSNAGAATERVAIQSAVYTLTGFPTVEKVRFTVEGKDRGPASNGRMIEDWWGHVGLAGQPWDRDPAIDVLEPIAVFSPLDGASSSGSLTVSGEASTFEANVQMILRDASGTAVVATFTTATLGAPGRGSFSKTIRFRPPASAQTWTLEVFEESAENGSVRFMENRTIRVG